MGTNWVQIVLGIMAGIIIGVSGVFNFFEKHLPAAVSKSFRYGKFASEKKTKKVLEVPKAWFKHFYVFSSTFSGLALYFFVMAYFYDQTPSKFVYNILDCTLGYPRKASVTPGRALLAISLLTIQCFRRLYDTQFISVFSKKARMNFSHYIVGFVHYAACVLAIVGEAPNFTTEAQEQIELKWTDLGALDLVATFLFFWAWTHQYKVTVILANLRKNEKGEVVSQNYKLPKGDWFEYVSSPHSLAEMLMYISLTFILWDNVTWRFVLVWVISNQVETSLLSHWWYQEKFKDIPKQRKAVVPFIL